MPAVVSTLSLERPRSLKRRWRCWRVIPTLTPIAGCTDVYVGLHFGTMPQKRFIDLWDLKELRGISVEGDVLRIGALTTYTEIIASKIVQKRVPMLVAAAREVGGAQIQNRGTLGGNVANASPAGDTLPVLAAANARIVLRSQPATRTVPFDAFYTGYRKSVRQPDELITAIEIPRIDGAQWWRKVGTRRAQAISKIMMAGVRGTDVRVAHRIGRADGRARDARRGGAVGRRHRSPTRRRRCGRRSRRSTMCDRRGSIARRSPRTCSRSSGRRRHEGCKGAGVHGCMGAGGARCWCCSCCVASRRAGSLAIASWPPFARRWRRRCRFPTAMTTARCRLNGNTEALWMVRPLQPGDRSIEVIANPLNEVNQLRATRAMAQIENNIAGGAAARRAAVRSRRGGSEAHRQVAGSRRRHARRRRRRRREDRCRIARHDRRGRRTSRRYKFDVDSSIQPAPSTQVTIPGAVAVIAMPSNTYRDAATRASSAMRRRKRSCSWDELPLPRCRSAQTTVSRYCADRRRAPRTWWFACVATRC